MTDPTVACIMLTHDRADYARRAAQNFRAQTYANKRMMVYNGGTERFSLIGANEAQISFAIPPVATIGYLRNEANRIAGDQFGAEIFAHWDDDDYSHPNRIAEQVALLQASGADCLGYREMIFWREPKVGRMAKQADNWGDAFLYSNPDPSYCLGTSLCYWRRTWERNPFSERNGPNPRERGEDREFLRGIKSVGVMSIADPYAMEIKHEYASELVLTANPRYQPRMIARIHAQNSAHYPMDELCSSSSNWRRSPEWDDRCRLLLT